MSISKYKSLQKVYYADKENQKVIEALWWNWSSRCGDVELDVITTDMSKENSQDGTRLDEDNLLRVDITCLFEDELEAINYLKEQ